MKLRIITGLVLANLIVVSAQSPKATERSPEPIRDVDSYAIYAMLLPRAWSNNSGHVMLLQQETVLNSLCSSSKGAPDADWAVAERNFKAENRRVGLLLKDMLKLEIPYRLIARAEIAADDARLERKYPGTWQRLPESMEYAYVSAVGFNATKTRAIVHVGLRSNGFEYWLDKREGKWVVAPFGCAWIA
jgi:hypothetical protein